jgi:hypothetical protein
MACPRPLERAGRQVSDTDGMRTLIESVRLSAALEAREEDEPGGLLRDLYATTMRLVHVADGDAFAVACDRAADWAWQRLESEPPDFAVRPFGTEPENPSRGDVVVRWMAFLDGSAAKALELRLEHPDSQDDSLVWVATVAVSELEGAVRASVRLERGAHVHLLAPAPLELRAPAVTQELMRPPLSAFAGSLALTPGVMTVARRDAESFVQAVLASTERALPVIVASCNVDAAFLAGLARGTAGLAQVVRGADPEADELLRGLLRDRRSEVPRGGLRLFWPGFGTEGDQLRHPYWTAAQLRAGRARGRSVVGRIVGLLAPISTGRVPGDPALIRARRDQLHAAAQQRQEREQARRERARAERERRRQELASQPSASKVEELERRLEFTEHALKAAEDEREEAVSQAAANESRTIEQALEVDERNTELGRRVAVLEAETAALRANLKTLTQFSERSKHRTEDDDDPIPAEIETWDELAEFLPELEGPAFRLTDRAVDCTDSSRRYPRPADMWDALVRLERVARAYSEQHANVNMRFEAFATQVAGLEIALQDSTYEDDYYFEYDGRVHSRLPHVKVDDAKSPNEVGRVYFALDPDNECLIVDWFGTKPDRPRTPRTSVAANS